MRLYIYSVWYLIRDMNFDCPDIQSTLDLSKPNITIVESAFLRLFFMPLNKVFNTTNMEKRSQTKIAKIFFLLFKILDLFVYINKAHVSIHAPKANVTPNVGKLDLQKNRRDMQITICSLVTQTH